MAGEGKGFLGSLAVHAGILAVLVGASWYASRHTGENLEAVDPLLVTLDGIPGKKPGQVGKIHGVAQGDESGVAGGVPRIHLKKLDLAKLEQERQQAAEQANQPSHQSGKTDNRPTAKTNPGSSGNRTTLEAFNKSNPNRGGGSASGKVGGIGGVKVAFGRNYGTGENGGEGGSASERQLYAGQVKARFQSAWTDLLAAEGASLESVGSCGVSVRVDAAGGVSFSGWINAPRDSRFAQLVKQAVAQIGNCGKPPGGKGFEIDFPRVGVSDG
jgi:hypothetical protein